MNIEKPLPILKVEDFDIAKYEDRFLKKEGGIKIGTVTSNLFADGLNECFNYIYNGDLVYLKFLKNGMSFRSSVYEVFKFQNITEITK